jgi:hypothetical protein
MALASGAIRAAMWAGRHTVEEMLKMSTNLAEIAIELTNAANDASLAECAFALELEAMAAGRTRAKLEVLASRIGLSADASAKVLDDWQRRARLVHAASAIMRRLIPHEAALS